MKTKLFFLLGLLFAFAGLNAQGTLNTNFQNVVGGSDSDKGSAAVLTNDGNTVYIGYYKSSTNDFSANYGNYDCFVRKVDTGGNLLWQTTFGGSDVEYIYDITEDANQNLIVVGTSKSNDNDITGNHGNYDYLVVKMDSTGAIVWQKSFGGTDIDKAISVGLASDGGYYVVGYTNSVDGDVVSNHGGYDIWLLKLDAAGNISMQNSYGGSLDDKSSDLFIISEGANNDNVIISGYSKSSDGDLTMNNGNYDYWVMLTDETGVFQFGRTFGGSGIDKDPKIGIDPFTEDYSYLVGYSNSTDGDITAPLGGFDIWAVGLDANGDVAWSKNYGGTGNDFSTDAYYKHQVSTVPQENVAAIYISAYSDSDDTNFDVNNGNTDAWALVLNEQGNVIYKGHFGGSATDRFTAIQNVPIGVLPTTISFVGTTKSDDGTLTSNYGNYDAWLVNVDFEAELLAISDYDLDIKVYPNPVSGFVNIEANSISQIQIYDLTGKLVINEELNDKQDTYSLFIGNLSKGQYVMKVSAGEGVNVTKILVK